jgi:hypothetical protein
VIDGVLFGSPGRLLKKGACGVASAAGSDAGAATKAMPERIGEEREAADDPAPPQPLAVAGLLLR